MLMVEESNVVKIGGFASGKGMAELTGGKRAPEWKRYRREFNAAQHGECEMDVGLKKIESLCEKFRRMKVLKN